MTKLSTFELDSAPSESNLIAENNLRQLQLSIGAFVHELNNAVHSANNNFQLLRPLIDSVLHSITEKENHDSATIENDLLPCLSGIETSLQLIQSISKNFRHAIAQTNSSSNKIIFQESNISLVLEQVVHLAKSIGHNSIQISMHCPINQPLLLPVEALQQILLNILINAIHAIEESPSITSPRIQLIANLKGNKSLLLTIKDNGIGIPKDKLSIIMKPYVTSKPKDKGSGLGLYVVQSLLQSIQGCIDISSTEGQGTVVSIKIPLGVHKC